MNEEEINNLSNEWKVDTTHLLERLLEENPKRNYIASSSSNFSKFTT